jgi:hypothetical protein
MKEFINYYSNSTVTKGAYGRNDLTYDVFLSHRSKDKSRDGGGMRKLASRLTKERRFIPLRLNVSSPTRLDEAHIKV